MDGDYFTLVFINVDFADCTLESHQAIVFIWNSPRENLRKHKINSRLYWDFHTIIPTIPKNIYLKQKTHNTIEVKVSYRYSIQITIKNMNISFQSSRALSVIKWKSTNSENE